MITENELTSINDADHQVNSSKSRWKELMSSDTLELIITYLGEDKDRMMAELVCTDLRQACLAVESRDFLKIFNELNDEDLILKPLKEEAVTEEEISNFETRMPGFNIDFYTRELLKRTNGRMDWHDAMFHPVNIIAPIEEWTKDFGYLFFKDKQVLLNCLGLSDFNFVHECLVCIGSSSQKISWGAMKLLEYNPSLTTGSVSSETMASEYNPFHTRVRKLYADKNFNLYDLEYKSFDDYSFTKLGNMKQWFKTLLPQQKMNIKLVTKREPIRYASNEKKNDPEYVLKYLKNNGSQLKYVSRELRNNRDIVLAAVNNYLDSIQYSSDEIKDDEKFMKDILLMHPLTIRFCSARVKETEIVREAIRSKPFRMEEIPSLSVVDFIPKCIIDNKEYALNMIQKTCNTYLSLSENLKEDREICLASVKNGLCISKIYPKFTDEKEFGLISVKNSCHKYKYLSDRLQKDRDIVMITLRNVTYRLDVKLPVEVADNKSFIIESITKQNAEVLFGVISDRLKADKEVALKLVTYQGSIYKNLPEPLKLDTEVLTVALTSMGCYFSNVDYIPDQMLYLFCNDYSKALLLLRSHASVFPLISHSLRLNKQFVIEAVGQIYGSKIDITHIDTSLLLDEDVLLKIANSKLGEDLLKLPNKVHLSDKILHLIVMNNPGALEYMKQTPELIHTALTNGKVGYSFFLRVIDKDLLTLDLLMIALKNNICRWVDLPEKFSTKECILQILEKYPKLYTSLDNSQKRDTDIIKLAIKEPTNFKAIVFVGQITEELVIEAIKHTTSSADVEVHIYNHLPPRFYANEEIHNLLKETIPNIYVQ